MCGTTGAATDGSAAMLVGADAMSERTGNMAKNPGRYMKYNFIDGMTFFMSGGKKFQIIL